MSSLVDAINKLNCCGETSCVLGIEAATMVAIKAVKTKHLESFKCRDMNSCTNCGENTATYTCPFIDTTAAIAWALFREFLCAIYRYASQRC
jgi:hypothetical protein